MIIEKVGNIFTTKCQTIVNTVNCVGIMGAGIAYEFRLRYPDLYEKYQNLCHDKQIDIGKLWIYRHEELSILNFPTKKHWKYPSKEQYLHQGLQKFVDTYKQKGITSIAFPLLGADRGGIDPLLSLKIMNSYLSKCDIDVEIWHFDPEASDDLFEEFKSIFQNLDDQTIKKESKIRIDKVLKVREAMELSHINSLSSLLRVNGIGEATLEKLFFYISNYKKNNLNLFTYMEES